MKKRMAGHKYAAGLQLIAAHTKCTEKQPLQCTNVDFTICLQRKGQIFK